MCRPRKVRLSLVKVNETSIAPRENVSYAKETQTVAIEPAEKDGMPLLSSLSSSYCLSSRSSSNVLLPLLLLLLLLHLVFAKS